MVSRWDWGYRVHTATTILHLLHVCTVIYNYIEVMMPLKPSEHMD